MQCGRLSVVQPLRNKIFFFKIIKLNILIFYNFKHFINLIIIDQISQTL